MRNRKHCSWASLSVLWTGATDWFLPVDAGGLEWTSTDHPSSINRWLMDAHGPIVDGRGENYPINPHGLKWSVNHQQMVDWWLFDRSWMLMDTHRRLWTTSQNLSIGPSAVSRWSWHSKMLLHCQWTLMDGDKFYNFVCDQCPALWRHCFMSKSHILMTGDTFCGRI